MTIETVKSGSTRGEPRAVDDDAVRRHGQSVLEASGFKVVDHAPRGFGPEDRVSLPRTGGAGGAQADRVETHEVPYAVARKFVELAIASKEPKAQNPDAEQFLAEYGRTKRSLMPWHKPTRCKIAAKDTKMGRYDANPKAPFVRELSDLQAQMGEEEFVTFVHENIESGAWRRYLLNKYPSFYAEWDQHTNGNMGIEPLDGLVADTDCGHYGPDEPKMERFVSAVVNTFSPTELAVCRTTAYSLMHWKATHFDVFARLEARSGSQPAR